MTDIEVAARRAAGKLKRCPFCPDGGDPFVFGDFERLSTRAVECGKCGSRGTLYGSGNVTENEDRAIEAWNTRATAELSSLSIDRDFTLEEAAQICHYYSEEKGDIASQAEDAIRARIGEKENDDSRG